MPTSESSEKESLGSIGREVAEDAVRLVRAEVALAKAEVAASVKSAIGAIALFAGAAALLLFALIFLLGTLAESLGPVIFGSFSWLAWLVLGLLFLVVAVLLGFLGYRKVHTTINGGRQTVGTLKEDVEWLRHLTKRSENES